MGSTTNIIGVDGAIYILNSAFKAIDEGEKMGYTIVWEQLMIFLSKDWFPVLSFLIVLLLIALIRAFCGYWGMLGSVLYNYLYFGTLFLIGLIWSPAVFAGDIFHLICTAIIYPICYGFVGIILDKLGVRHGRRRMG